MIILYFTSFVFLLLFRKSKFIFIYSILLLWILFAFNTDNADRQIYLDRLQYYEAYSNFTEPLYTFIMKGLNMYNLDLQVYIISLSTLFFLILYFFVCKNTKNIGFVIALYMFSFFLFDIVQIRQTSSLCFVYLAFGALFSMSKSRRTCVIFALFIIIGSLLHISTLIFLFLLIPYSFDFHNCYKLAFISFFLMFFIYLLAPQLENIFIMADKVHSVMETATDNYDIFNVLRRIRVVVFQNVVFVFLFYYYNMMQKNDNVVNLIYKVSIVYLGLIPLLFISADIQRIYFVIAFVQYVALSRMLSYKKNNSLLISLSLISTFHILYTTILSNGNYNQVFMAVFSNNLFF